MAKLSDIVEITVEEGVQQILSEWSSLDLPVDLTWEDGTFPAMVARAGGYIRASGSREAVALKACTIGELLEGDALDLWSKSVYGHIRNGAQTAIWRMHVSCANGAGPYQITEGSMVATDGTLTFRATGDTTLFPAVSGYPLPVTVPSSGSAEIAVYCETPGSVGSDLSIGSINRLVTTFAGVTVQNIELIQSGADRESDKELKQRNSTWWATRNKLTLVRDAYIYYARSAHPAIKRVALDATNPRGAFTLDVYVAGDSGSPGTEAIAAVLADLQGRLAPEIGNLLEVKPATTYNQSVAGQIYYYSSFDATEVQNAIITAVRDMVKDIPIQGNTYGGFGQHRVLRSQYEKAILGAKVNGQTCVHLVNLTGPAESLELSVGQIVVTDISATSFNLGSIGLYAVTQ